MRRLHSTTHQIEALQGALDKLLQQPKMSQAAAQLSSKKTQIRIKPLPLRQRLVNIARRHVTARPWLKRPAGMVWALIKGHEFRIDTIERIEHLEQALQRQQQAQQAEIDRLAASYRHENLQLRLELNRLQQQLGGNKPTKTAKS